MIKMSKTITYYSNWYNIRSKVPIDNKTLMTINMKILDIATAHNGIKWIYVVDSEQLGKFDLNLNYHKDKTFAKNLSLAEVIRHLETIESTLNLYRKEYKIDNSYIMQTMDKERVRALYGKIADPNQYTENIERSIVGTIRGDYYY